MMSSVSWVGYPIDKWELVLYSDANLGGDLETSRKHVRSVIVNSCTERLHAVARHLQEAELRKPLNA